MINIDQKLTVWERFSLDEVHQPALELFLQGNPEATYLDIYEWATEVLGLDPKFSLVEGSEKLLKREENQGNPVLEVYVETE